MSPLAPVGNDAILSEAITRAEYVLRALRDAQADNARADYVMANARLACVNPALADLEVYVRTVKNDLVWRR